MTESVLHRQIAKIPEKSEPQKWIRRLVWEIAMATLLLMAIGSATRVMNAGLACPDWPLCYGQFIPSKQMNLQVFLEWFHRLDASLIGLSAIVLVGLSWWYRTDLPQWLPWAALFALGLIILQGILGGLTVIELLRFDIVTVHLGIALLFFSTLIVIGTMLLPYQGTGNTNKLLWVGLISTIFVYIQSLLGGVVASRWALYQCFGSLQLCQVMNSHIIGIFPATIATLTLVFIAWRTPSINPFLRKLANIAGLLLCLQILFGIATFRLHLQVEPLTVTHQFVGATLLGTLVAITVITIRDRLISNKQ